jgi:hypothetical protein
MIIPFSNSRRKQLRRGGARADLVMSGIVANNSERNRATLGAKPMRRGIHERQADHAETLLRNDDFFWGPNRTWLRPRGIQHWGS